jgi:hypothetical protein
VDSRGQKYCKRRLLRISCTLCFFGYLHQTFDALLLSTYIYNARDVVQTGMVGHYEPRSSVGRDMHHTNRPAKHRDAAEGRVLKDRHINNRNRQRVLRRHSHGSTRCNDFEDATPKEAENRHYGNFYDWWSVSLVLESFLNCRLTIPIELL